MEEGGINMNKKIYVYENFSDVIPKKLGVLYVEIIRGVETCSFEYDKQWLKETKMQVVLDPEIFSYEGRQYPNKENFGIFADSCPDRWGRVLMKRREAMKAKAEGRKPEKLYESDYLLGVYDETRMGALRFKVEEDGPFVSDDKDNPTPPFEFLRKLEQASLAFENDDNTYNDEWLKLLLKPGSSLGGARPKASVVDTENNLWIAKFPSKKDEYNIGAWEKIASDLAKLCGLNVPESELRDFSKYGSTFLVKRFDRDNGRRVHFASAMTMLGKTDGASAADGSSYLDLVSFIKRVGVRPKEDLKELWKRIVFNMAISNTDDHLRNHGFILEKNGWVLSPLYDINPVPYGDELSLNVGENDNRISIDNAIESAKYFELTLEEAKTIAKEILSTVKRNWEKLAEKYKISRNEIEQMRPAFSESEKMV